MMSIAPASRITRTARRAVVGVSMAKNDLHGSALGQKEQHLLLLPTKRCENATVSGNEGCDDSDDDDDGRPAMLS